jgi:hypothetical protein
MSEALGDFAADVGSAAVDAAPVDAPSSASAAALKERLRIPRARRRSAQSDEPLYVLFKEELPNIILGVALAGGFCPIVMWAVFVMLGIVQAIWDGALPEMPLLSLAFSALVCAIGGVIAFIYATFVFVFVYWAVYWFVRSLQMRGDVIWLAAFSGGLAGFVAVLPVFLLVLGTGPQVAGLHWGLMLAMIAMAGPTTVMGQIGGAWRVWRDWSYERSVAAAAVVDNVEAEESGATELAVGRRVDQKWIQFRIWHLLVLSFWVSLLLTAIRLCGIDVVAGIVLLVGWTVFQAVTLLVGGLMVRWWSRWKRRRQSRST